MTVCVVLVGQFSKRDVKSNFCTSRLAIHAAHADEGPSERNCTVDGIWAHAEASPAPPLPAAVQLHKEDE